MTVKKRDKTRQKLLVAAQEILLDEGFSGLTVNSLTKKAEMALGSFYNYYQSREDVVDAVMRMFLKDYNNTIDKVIKDLDDPAEIVAASTIQTLYLCKPFSTLGRLLVACSSSLPIYGIEVRHRFQRDVEAGIASGVFAPRNKSIAISMVSGASSGLMLDRFLGTLADEDLPLAAEQVLVMLGVPQKKAEKISKIALELAEPPELPFSSIELLSPVG